MDEAGFRSRNLGVAEEHKSYVNFLNAKGGRGVDRVVGEGKFSTNLPAESDARYRGSQLTVPVSLGAVHNVIRKKGIVQ